LEIFDIIGFDVAMHDFLVVKVAYRAQHLINDIVDISGLNGFKLVE
jgi:hypothetical protein